MVTDIPLSQQDVMGHRYKYVDINICAQKDTCKAEYSPMAGVTECVCGAIGWLSMTGDLYNSPEFMDEADDKFMKEHNEQSQKTLP